MDPSVKNITTFFHPLIALIVIGFSLTSCANKDTNDESERALYESAQKAMDSSQYEFALELFRKIELQHPFGRYAEQAQLESIYAYYKNDDFVSAGAAADRFKRQYPEHPNLDYVQYLKGLSNYHIDTQLASRFINNASAKRDLSAAKLAYRDFKTLILNYPNSEYLADAQKRMHYIRDVIARKELEIAHFYMQRAAYVAAINRSKRVLEDYPGSQASADALALLVYAYIELDAPELALNSLKVLKLNFPNSEKFLANGDLKPYENRYQEKVDWIDLLSFGYFNKNKDTERNTINEERLNQRIEGGIL